MARPDPEQMACWLSRRTRHGWSWAGLSRRSGQPVWRLRYWERRLAGTRMPRPRRGRAFVAVAITDPARADVSGRSALEIMTPSGYRVMVGRDFDPEHLRRVVQALERGC